MRVFSRNFGRFVVWRLFARSAGSLGKKGYRAFTLVELLTVVVIISILLTLTAVTTSRVRMLGRQAATVSNMRQIGLAIQQYTAENDGRLPGPLTVAVFNWVDPNTENTICSLGRYIFPYLGVQKSEAWLSYPTRRHLTALDCPALPANARSSEVAQYVKLDYLPTTEDNIFGQPASGAYGARGTISPQPKSLAGLTAKARRSAILATADQANWTTNALLPRTGVFDGKRLYLFLDGSVEGPILRPDSGTWER